MPSTLHFFWGLFTWIFLLHVDDILSFDTPKNKTKKQKEEGRLALVITQIWYIEYLSSGIPT